MLIDFLVFANGSKVLGVFSWKQTKEGFAWYSKGYKIRVYSKTIIIAFSEQGFESVIVPVAIGHTL